MSTFWYPQTVMKTRSRTRLPRSENALEGGQEILVEATRSEEGDAPAVAEERSFLQQYGGQVGVCIVTCGVAALFVFLGVLVFARGNIFPQLGDNFFLLIATFVMFIVAVITAALPFSLYRRYRRVEHAIHAPADDELVSAAR
jgi:hypothetical protein